MMICVTDKVENIVGKGENADYHNFLLFPQCFQKPSFIGLENQELCGKGVMAMVKSLQSVTCLCVSWLSQTSTDTTCLSKGTGYFSHMHQR